MPRTPRIKYQLLRALSRDPTQSGRWRITLVLLVCTITVLALIPAAPRELSLGWDKLNHCAAFAVLTGVAFLGFAQHQRWKIGAALVGYGALIEVLQSFTATRSAEWLDLFADCIGIAAGLALIPLVSRLAARWAGTKPRT